MWCALPTPLPCPPLQPLTAVQEVATPEQADAGLQLSGASLLGAPVVIEMSRAKTKGECVTRRQRRGGSEGQGRGQRRGGGGRGC